VLADDLASPTSPPASLSSAARDALVFDTLPRLFIGITVSL
jgi:hypothetical protein